MQRRTSQSWRELIEAWQTSDLTQKQFCAQQSIAYSGFHYWFKKFREEKSPAGRPSGFVPVKIASNKAMENNSAMRIELALPNGKSVKFYGSVDEQLLRSLLS
jgi:hypothetical protein